MTFGGGTPPAFLASLIASSKKTSNPAGAIVMRKRAGRSEGFQKGVGDASGNMGERAGGKLGVLAGHAQSRHSLEDIEALLELVVMHRWTRKAAWSDVLHDRQAPAGCLAPDLVHDRRRVGRRERLAVAGPQQDSVHWRAVFQTFAAAATTPMREC